MGFETATTQNDTVTRQIDELGKKMARSRASTFLLVYLIRVTRKLVRFHAMLGNINIELVGTAKLYKGAGRRRLIRNSEIEMKYLESISEALE